MEITKFQVSPNWMHFPRWGISEFSPKLLSFVEVNNATQTHAFYASWLSPSVCMFYTKDSEP